MVALCRALLHPGKFWVKTILGKIFFEHSGWHDTSRNASKSESGKICLEVKKILDEKKKQFEKKKLKRTDRQTTLQSEK